MTVRITKPIKLSVASLVLPAAIASSAAIAGTADKNYVGLNFANYDFNLLDDSLSGFGISGSKSINDTYYGFAEYTGVDEGNYDYTTYALGVGYSEKIDDKVDLDIELSYINKELEVGSNSADEGGFGASFGATYTHMDELELFGEVKITSVEDSDIVYTFGLEYKFPQNISAIGALILDDDSDIISVGAKYSF